ncbi:HEAT repeat domain-containing protein [Dapis sp. BLCC M172]|uniref:HEAT repeat domain-containing protein n=1 Tax=Dapis sp. BLCC M172 TaxID=2975281 RepID=UPI003CE91792
MIEWFSIVAGGQLVGFLAQEVLGKLAQEETEDYLKDFFKECITDFTDRITNTERETLEKATAEAIKELLELVQQELELAELNLNQIEEYTEPFKLFLKNESVLGIIGSSFNKDIKVLDTKKLATTWNQINPYLPKKLDWVGIANNYLKKAKIIRIKSDELRKILDAENQDKLENKNTEIRPDFDLKRYRKEIIEQYVNLKLDSLDPTIHAYHQLKSWEMFIPQNVRESQEFLPQVHEISQESRQGLKETGKFGEDFSQEQSESLHWRYLDRPIRSVVELVENRNYQHLVILGNPGSGKSTLLQYIALKWAGSPIKDLVLQPIPLLIELRTYVRNHDANKCKNFLGFLEKGSGVTCHLPQQQVHAKLQKNEAIVMFDGLDEVFDPVKREEIITDIHRFTNDYKNVRVIVTSRVIGYQPQKFRDAEFDHFMLQDLEDEQVEDFIQRWHDFTYQDEAEREKKRERFKRAIQESSAIKELSGNPLLLTMMAILNRHQEFPRDRVELYNQASRVLLHQWDIEMALTDAKIDPITIDYKDKQAILRRVAFFMQENKAGFAGNLIHRNDLEEIIKDYLKTVDINHVRTVARVLIEQLQTRNSILCFVGAEYYAFVHRTFWEYFCAREFVWQFEKEQKISQDELLEEVFGHHWQDEKWHEVLRLIAGMIDPKFVRKIISYLMEQDGEEEKFLNLFLAGKCLFEVRSRQSIGDVGSRLLNRLKDLTRYNLGYSYKPYKSYSQEIDPKNAALVREIRTQAVEVVAATWRNERFTYNWLKQRAKSDDDWNVRREAVRQIATGWKDESGILDLLKQWLESDNSWNVRREAVAQIATGWKDESGILELLKQWLESDNSWNVRREAVAQIATGWKDESGILELLKQRVESDKNWNVRLEAVRQITTGGKDKSGILELLKQRVESDNSWNVRLAAVRQIATGWKDEPGILKLLKKRVESDSSWNVRREALRQIATGWKHQPAMLELLKQCLESDNSWNVRCEALRQIAIGWKHQPAIFELLKQCLESDNSWNVRREALRQIATVWKHQPAILKLLKQSLESDKNWNVRLEAVRQIVTGWKHQPAILKLLKQRVESDNSWNVRREAVRQIATGWKDESEILDLLKQRVQSDSSSTVRREAVEQIATGWKHQPGILKLLKQRVQSDSSSTVRVEALRQIATGWQDESEILDLLKQWVKSDNSWDVRVEALRQIATGWKDDSETLELLKQWVESDDNSDVRVEALRQIITGWKYQPGIFELFYHTALNDPFQPENEHQYNPRQIALEAIVKQYRDHPQTLPLLKDRAAKDQDKQLRKWAKRKLRRLENMNAYDSEKHATTHR